MDVVHVTIHRINVNILCSRILTNMRKLKLVAIERKLVAIYSSRDGFVRKRLICDRRDFSSSVRFLALRDLRVGTLLAGR